jgi:hypothetical protein
MIWLATWCIRTTRNSISRFTEVVVNSFVDFVMQKGKTKEKCDSNHSLAGDQVSLHCCCSSLSMPQWLLWPVYYIDGYNFSISQRPLSLLASVLAPQSVHRLWKADDVRFPFFFIKKKIERRPAAHPLLFTTTTTPSSPSSLLRSLSL